MAKTPGEKLLRQACLSRLNGIKRMSSGKMKKAAGESSKISDIIKRIKLEEKAKPISGNKLPKTAEECLALLKKALKIPIGGLKAALGRRRAMKTYLHSSEHKEFSGTFSAAMGGKPPVYITKPTSTIGGSKLETPKPAQQIKPVFPQAGR